MGGELQRLRQRALGLFPPAPSRTPQLVTPQLVTPMAGLHVLRQQAPSQFEATIYQPMLCLILEGRKEMTFAERTHRLGSGQCALVSHDLPIVSRVREVPYLVVLLEIDVDVLRNLCEGVAELHSGESGARSLEVHGADSRLLDAIERYLALDESELDARVLGPLVLGEIHYRLVSSPLGGMLRRLLLRDGHANAIARAITLLRRDFRAPIAVKDLAKAVGMSVSSFHEHFKAITSSSPLQYQKGLRLLEARRLLLAGSASVTAAAFDVGYESASQFSREYTRKFGRPPSHDVAHVNGRT